MSRDADSPAVSRRAMRNMVRWRNRQDGNYWDGSAFTGRKSVVTTEPLAEPVRRGSGMPHAAPLQAAREFVMNSEAHPERKPRPCIDCGRPHTSPFPRCSRCWHKAKKRHKALQASRA